MGYWGKNLSRRLNLEKAQGAIPFNSAAFYQLLILIVMFSFIKVKAKILELSVALPITRDRLTWIGTLLQHIWDKVFKSGLSKFFNSCLPQNLYSPLLNTFSFALAQKATSWLKFYFLLIVATSSLIYDMFLKGIFISFKMFWLSLSVWIPLIMIMLLFNRPHSWCYDIEHHYLVGCFICWNSCFLSSRGLKMNSQNINTEIQYINTGYDCS